MVDFKRFVGLITFKYCWWNKLLTAKATYWNACNTLSCVMIIFISASLLWMLLAPMICFMLASFLKAILESLLKDFLQIWFACNICQCFIRISFKFGSAWLSVTDNSIHCLSWRFRWWSSCFRSCWATFWICCKRACFLYSLLTNC